MTIIELSSWLAAQVETGKVPASATIDWIDVSECYAEFLDLEYIRETNTVRITEI